MIQEKILEFLKRREQHYVSGDQLSQRLGISRQALWKHIQDLKDSGYDIVAVPHLGYQLVSSPDRLLPFEVTNGLKTKFIGRKVYYFEVVSSTMDAAMELGIKAAPEGTIIIAEGQTKGRGRLGRHWSSPKYKGIYLSLLLRPKILPQQAPLLTLMSAVSVCEAIKETVGLEAQIKWPNDIMIQQKKLGGILTELSAEMDNVRFIVLGIGINVNNNRKSLVVGATSLKEQKKENISRRDLLQEILCKIEINYLCFQEKGPRAIIEKWHGFNFTLGRRIRVSCQKERIEGLALDIDSDGGLLVRKDSGLIQKVTAGDVIHCR